MAYPAFEPQREGKLTRTSRPFRGRVPAVAQLRAQGMGAADATSGVVAAGQAFCRSPGGEFRLLTSGLRFF
jgi:hypothetical protein